MYYMEELYLFIEVLENAIVMAGTSRTPHIHTVPPTRVLT